MIKYAVLQLKRVAKRLPAFIFFITVIALVALVCLGAIKRSDTQKSQRFKVAITGETENKHLNLAMVAATALDSSRFSMELVKMSEDAAKEQMKSKKLTAYVVLDEDFIEKARRGETTQVEVVTSLGEQGVTTLFKNEITKVITDIYASAQSGVFGVADAMSQQGQGKHATKTMNALLEQYVDIILKRSETYDVKEQGFADGFSQSEYYAGAIATLFLLISAMPFCTLFTSSDPSLCRLMHSRGVGVTKQLLSEMTAFCLPFFILSCAVSVFTKIGVFSLILPIVLICTMSFFIWELSGDVISALLAHFFATAVMGFCSGCFYPISALPMSMQKIGRALPTGVVSRYISQLSIGYYDVGATLIYCVCFFILCIAVRTFKRRRSV